METPTSMHKHTMNISRNQPRLSNAAGVSVVELLVVFAAIGILSAIALNSFNTSNRSFRIAGAARELSAFMEKARVDSVRRHELPSPATVVLNSASSYTVNADFSGIGAVTARTINLPAGTTIRYSLPPATTAINPATTPRTISFDWRGQTAATVLLTLSDVAEGVTPSTVVVGRAGAVSTNTTVTGPVTAPTPQNTTVTTTTAIKSMQ